MSQSDKTKSKRRLRWLWLPILLIPALLVGGAFLRSRGALRDLEDAYVTVKPAVGAISVTVYGSGSIEAGRSDRVYAPVSGQVQEVRVDAGDRVAEGDVLAVLSSEALETEIGRLQASIETLDQQIARLPSITGSSTIAAPVAGRIKVLYAAEGDPVEAVMAAEDALCLLSTDGQMMVEVTDPIAWPVPPGGSVTVQAGGSSLEGTVMGTKDGVTVVLFADTTFDQGQSVTLLDSAGTRIADGQAMVHAPVYVTGSSGIIRTVRRAIGDKVSKGATLFTLESAGYSSAYLSLVDQRASALADLRTARSLRTALTLTAPADGIVETLAMTEMGQVMENQLVCTIGETATFRMQVMVDELDIAGVKVGQSAELQLAAFDYRTFPAVVERISSVGRTTGGVTTYPVTLRIDPADGILLGMSASVDILVADRTDALTLPLEALKVDGARTYVTIVRDNGTRSVSTEERDVTVGLANGTLVEILSGLTPSDEVQLVEKATSTFPGMFGRNPGPTSAPGR